MTFQDFSEYKRRPTKKIKVGNVFVGGDAPISVQTMTNTITSDVDATVKQILECEIYGLDLVRAAINTKEDALAIKKIKEKINVPFIADIQYDYKLAMWAAENGADCIRINPGNMQDKEGLKSLVTLLNERDIPIRIGVNSGSIDTKIIDKFGGVNAKSLVESAFSEVKTLEDLNFTNIKVSIKSSDIYVAVAAYENFSKAMDYPLHLGITEAGPYEEGMVKSAIGMGILLHEGIGDTIRVSLTDDPYKEIIAGQNILKSLNLNAKGINLISCPTCARTNGQMIEMVKEFKEQMPNINGKLNVAIMGCSVNGPGEAREADIGIALMKNKVNLFKKGKIIRTLDKYMAVSELINEIKIMDDEANNWFYFVF